MKAVILAGGYGTRISEETVYRPKPMVEIGGKPILWHLLKMYSKFGVQDFIICCGYKGYVIKEYFANYFMHMSDVTFDMTTNRMEVHRQYAEPWRVTLVDTGEDTMTGGRLKRIQKYVEHEDSFFFTYGDGVSDININELLTSHRKHGGYATITTVCPPSRFGAVSASEDGLVTSFREKPIEETGRINGGFFVLSPKVFSYIEGDRTVWEREPIEKLVRDKRLYLFEHQGFWHPMDTLRDKNYLEELWVSEKAPWKTWVD